MTSKMTYFEKCFHVLVITGAIGFTTSIANANTNYTTVRAEIIEHQKTVINQVPYQVEICRDVQVSGDKTGDALTGAIIGGVIGNNVTKNVDNGGAIGAIIGGLIGHDKSDAKGGTQRQCRVETRYNEEVSKRYSHSTITFTENGRTRTITFQK